MAYYNEEDENEQQELGQQVGGQPVGGGMLSGGTPGGSSGESKKPDRPGNFVGIKQYLDANKNQANQFGEKVAQGIQDKIGGANQALGGFQNKFEQEANKGLIGGFDTAQDDAKNIVNKAATLNQGQFGDQDVKRFGEIANAQYSGPKTSQESQAYNPVYQSVQEAQKLADLSKNEQGSQELIKGFANKTKQYTPGENRLDSYMLNTAENREKLQGARQGAEALGAGLEGVQKSGSDYSAQLQEKNDELRNNARDLLSNTALSKKAAIQEGLAGQQKSVEETNRMRDGLFQSLSNQNAGALELTPEQMSYLGLNDGQRLFGAARGDINSLLPSSQLFDPNAAIDRNDQARLAALQELSGSYGGDFDNPYDNAEVAGSANYKSIDPKLLSQKSNELSNKYKKDYADPKEGGGLAIAKNQAYRNASNNSLLKGLPPIESLSVKDMKEFYLPEIIKRTPGINGDDNRKSMVLIKDMIQQRIKQFDDTRNYGDVVKKKEK